MRNCVPHVVLFLVLILLSGCGNYTATTKAAREDFYSGKFAEAAKGLEEGAKTEGVDQVLYLFDRATALYNANDYPASIDDFHKVDDLTVIKDYTSLATEAATMVTNDKIVTYKGEDFEKVLISQYLALNYLFLGKWEDALVECRRVNHKLQMMISQGKRKYRLNPMASYLSAVIYEAAGEWNDAYVDYQQSYKLAPQFARLKEDLYRLAWRNGIGSHMSDWAEKFALSAEDRKRIQREANTAELVVVLEVGRAPFKEPNPAWTALPRFSPSFNPVDRASIEIVGGTNPTMQSDSLFSVEQTAIQDLDDKFAGLIAKRVAGVIAKEVISDQVAKRTNSELLGALARLGMYVADQADLRSWQTLPRDFQIVRIPLDLEALGLAAGGPLKIKVTPVGAGGTPVNSTLGVQEKVIAIDAPVKGKRGRKYFTHVRII